MRPRALTTLISSALAALAAVAGAQAPAADPLASTRDAADSGSPVAQRELAAA